MNHNTKVMLGAVISILAIMALSGCGVMDKPVDTVTMNVAVPVKTEAPKELYVLPSDLPTWYAPDAAGVSSCLMPKGETQTQTLMKKLNGWQKFGTAAQ